MIKKNDLILAATILAIALAAALFIAFTKEEGGKAVVMVNGQVYKTLPLNEDIVLPIFSGGAAGDEAPVRDIQADGKGGFSGDGYYNVLEIKGGKASMIEANCPDKLCVNHGSICYNHESIVCLPHKVMVQIRDGEESDIDIIAN